MEPKKVGELINRLRTQNQMTQKELAEKLNVTDKAVSKWERGECCPDISLLLMMRDLFDIDIENLMSGEIPPEVQNDITGKKIHYYDFKRPSIFSASEMRLIANICELLCQKMQNALAEIFSTPCALQLEFVDELTNEECIRSLDQNSFYYNYSYNNNGFAIQIDSNIGKTLIKQDKEKYPEITNFDCDVLNHYCVEKFSHELQKMLYDRTNKSIPEESFIRKTNGWGNHWRILEEYGSDMCCLVGLKCTLGQTIGVINIQFNKDYFCRNLRKLGFFGDPTRIKNLSNIKKISNHNTFVEFGRFSNDEITFNPDDVIILDRHCSDGLMLIHNNKLIGSGEAVIICPKHSYDGKWGIKLWDIEEKEIVYDEKDYISVRLASRFCSQEEIANAQEGSIFEMDNNANEPVSIIKNGKKIAQGEIVVRNENFAIKILE